MDIIVSMRTFPEHGIGPPSSGALINGAGLDSWSRRRYARHKGLPTTISRRSSARLWPGFVGERARERDLVEAYTLSVECDHRPAEARKVLELVLGPATVVVESGGVWFDPSTGETQSKLHLHWRLNEAARARISRG